MKALIIPFPAEHVQRKKQRPLSKLMIANLLAAYALERQGLFFGPQDIKGSLTSLINRGLIIRIEISLNGKTESIWHVSYEAIEMLKALGIDVICVKPRVKGVPVISFLSLTEAYSIRSEARCLEL
jgi:ABC-type uncharacterized transport system permease subunit